MPTEKEFRKIVWKESIVTVVAILFGFGLSEVIGPPAFVFMIAALLGQWFSGWYMKRAKTNTTLIAIIAWSNVVLWLSIPFGLFVSLATLGFSKLIPANKKKFMILGVVGIVLTLLNLAIGLMPVPEPVAGY